jgi:2-oxoglutarate ferredoxin oxidoreductase subunit alpha
LPTKTEQSDLLQALYGRHGEAPCVVIAARSPADCFECAYEASRLAVRHMTPVLLLSDGFIANGAEPWRIPAVEDLPPIPVSFRTDPEGFLPYSRDEATLARPWAIPGTARLEHRIGGLEKSDGSGNVSYEPLNHERMVHLRAEKIARVALDIPPAEPEGERQGGLLVLGWGSTYGSITGAVRRARAEGIRVTQLHLRYLNPLPSNLGEVLSRYDRILVPEMNLGQLAFVLQGTYLREILSQSKVEGQPFRESEILDRIRELA